MIHRYKVMLEFIAKHEPLKSKEGLAPLVASVEGFLNDLKSNPAWGDIDAVVDAFRHCKVQKAYDQGVVKVMFVGPHIIQINGILTTLGSITSKLLRSAQVPRKYGTAPMGHMERTLNGVLQARKAKW